MTDALIRAAGLRKSYGEGTARVVALDGVDFEVARGELLAVVGPSGSGKTTLLHCAAGLACPDAGTVTFDGVDLAGLDDDARSDLRARSMGFVFQSLNLLPALTVSENIELPLVLNGTPAADMHGRADAVLERVGLAGRGGAQPHELSGGEQQRVALARALVIEPQVIWADEPTGALDSASSQGVITLLRQLADHGRTIVVVTHSDAVAAVAARRLVLRDGRVVA